MTYICNKDSRRKVNPFIPVFIINIEILKKISQWPKCIEITIKKLEPHRIPVYLYELAALFHSYWNLGKNNPELRFINQNKSRLILLKAISHIIKNGMNIIGVTTPEKM